MVREVPKATTKKPRVPKGKKLLQVPLDTDLHKQFKVFAISHDTTMISLVEDFVRQVVVGKGSRKEK